VYYNRHFGKSRQFNDFLEVLEDTEVKTKDYARILLTNCDKTISNCVLIQKMNSIRVKPSHRIMKTEQFKVFHQVINY
jgi:hypothetical protein